VSTARAPEKRVHWHRHTGGDEEENVAETGPGIEVGQEMPTFELPDEEGRPFDLRERLEERPLVLVFYRGYW
jgi:hypothetical protein